MTSILIFARLPLNRIANFILAIVIIDDEQYDSLYYNKNPLRTELEFGVNGIKCTLNDLFPKAVTTGKT